MATSQIFAPQDLIYYWVNNVFVFFVPISWPIKWNLYFPPSWHYKIKI